MFDRIIAIRLVIGKKVFAIICIYAPQSNLSESNNDEFYHSLQGVLAKNTDTQEVLIYGYFNGHIKASTAGYGKVHGDLAFGKRNADGEKILEFSVETIWSLQIRGSRKGQYICNISIWFILYPNRLDALQRKIIKICYNCEGDPWWRECFSAQTCSCSTTKPSHQKSEEKV